MQPENKAKALTIIDDPRAPEFFASELSDASMDFDSIRLSFASTRFNKTITIVDKKEINIQVVMSVQSAISMVNFLRDFLDKSQPNVMSRPLRPPKQ